MHKRFEIAFSTPEPVPTQELHKHIGLFLDGYTLQAAQGAWAGQTEHSYIVTTNLDPAFWGTPAKLAQHLREVYDQQCVLLTSWDITQKFV